MSDDGRHAPSAAVTVRTAWLSDSREIARLTSQLGYEVPASVVTARLERMLARSDQRFLVAQVGTRIAGWVHVAIAEYVETGLFAVIGGLVVDRDRRRSGIGRLLMREAEAWARESGCPVVRLSSSVPRVASHRFYERIGYTNIKAQYAFAKALDPDARIDWASFVPHVTE